MDLKIQQESSPNQNERIDDANKTNVSLPVSFQSFENKPIVEKKEKKTPHDLVIESKKYLIVEYLRRFPFYKWAAKSVAIDQDTLINWRKEDKEFSDRVEIARSEGIKYFGGRATPDLILKSADPETFRERKEIDLTTQGKPIIPLMGGTSSVPGNNSISQTPETK